MHITVSSACKMALLHVLTLQVSLASDLDLHCLVRPNMLCKYGNGKFFFY